MIGGTIGFIPLLIRVYLSYGAEGFDNLNEIMKTPEGNIWLIGGAWSQV
jgi:hypothetical protein